MYTAEINKGKQVQQMQCTYNNRCYTLTYSNNVKRSNVLMQSTTVNIYSTVLSNKVNK